MSDEKQNATLEMIARRFESAWPRMSEDFEPWQKEQAFIAYLHGFNDGLERCLESIAPLIARIEKNLEGMGRPRDS